MAEYSTTDFCRCGGFSDSHVLVNHGLKDELGTEKCFHPFANFFVEVLPAIEHGGQGADDHFRLVGLADGGDHMESWLSPRSAK